MATLEPDLILSSKLRHEPIYDRLSQIASTVFTKTTGVTRKANFEKHAEAINRTGGAKKVMEGYEDRLERFGDQVGGKLGETEVSVVRFLPGETTRERITSDPLWQKLDAVREGRVHEVSDDLWMLGIGPPAEGVVDDLERCLTGK